MDHIKTYTEETFDHIFKDKNDIEYDFNISKMSQRDRRIIKMLNDFGIKGKNCLDIGPGTGRWLQYLKINSSNFLGAIDISQVSIDRYKHFCDKAQKADVEYEKFDFKSDYFDIILSFMVLEHLRNPENFISEIIRVAKKGASILMTIPNIVSLKSRIRVLFGIMPTAITSDKTHIKFYTKRELKNLFKPFNLLPVMIPTYFTIHPFKSNRLRIPSNSITQSFDDHLLFKIEVKK